MKKQAKTEFGDLENDWKDGIAAMSTEEIDKRISDIAKAEAESQKAKKDDQHLQDCKESVKAAGEGYREHTKMSKLRIEFCMRVLEDRGKK